MTTSMPETLVEALERATSSWPEKTALTSDASGETLSYRELDRRTAQYAAALAELGVGAGDRVGVCLPNGLAYPVIWLALAKLRAAMVPVNRQYKHADARHVLEHSGARIVVTNSELAGVFRECVAQGLELRAIASLDGGGDGVTLLLLRDTAAIEVMGLPRGDDTVNVQYSSGTTGKPKGCLLSHRYWLTIAQKNVEIAPAIAHEDVLLTAQPFSYMDPQWNLAASLLVGASLVILDGFHPTTFWERVRYYRATFLYVIGAMPTLMLKMPEAPSDRQHAVARIYCSAIPQSRHAELEERFGAPWFETYGMTEVGGVCAVTPEDHDALVGSGCIGTPNDYREIRVVDAGDDVVRPGTRGELVVRGVGLMDRYLDDDDENARAFRNGWFHTGDIVVEDNKGRLYFVGRIKDMIRRSGENIAAAEVEEVLQRHPQVRIAACVAVPDDLRGEEIWAVVVPADIEAPPDIAALQEFCGTHLARFKVPRYWEIRATLPLTPSARVEKGSLRQEASGDLTRAIDMAAESRA
jgi:crotonobetaine/carnitine-CoA ligase